ncbi:MAG: DegV family protein [Coriobacteriales bacterium]|nr:DegV family protein [Coriobacteriales bacterium]
MATRNRKCNIVIDSCCDLPADLVESFDVETVPFTFIMDDGEHLDDLWTSMTPHEFYERMRKGEHSSTSQVPYGTVQAALKRAATSGIPTVFICFSSCLSGTFECIVSTWDEMKGDYPDAELHIVDSKLASAAEGLLVMEAVRQCDRGLTATELAAWVEEARYYVHGYFTLAGLETLRRGGRIPDMAAVAGAKLDIRPILCFDLDGNLAFFGAARGRKKSIKQLLQIFHERFQISSSRMVLVAAADTDKEQTALAEQLLKLPDKLSVWQTSIGPVIGSHVGPDMIAVVFWGSDRRENMSLTDRIAKAISERKRLADERSADERSANERSADECSANERLAHERLANERLVDAL